MKIDEQEALEVHLIESEMKAVEAKAKYLQAKYILKINQIGIKYNIDPSIDKVDLSTLEIIRGK